MLPLTYPTECGTAAVVRPLTDAERLTELRRDLDADLHYALVAQRYVRWPYGEPELAAEALYGATTGTPDAQTDAEAAFSLVVRAAARGESAVSVGTLFIEWTKLARARLLDTLVEITEDGQRVTFGSRQ
ncbi:hypothetical protein [Bordetella bronchiseptica]|uniref:N-acetyltransferase YedL n=1 Tax=Bordetella bronchiseptica 00-P-2796 TaxID=1331199 RepID=A0ABR4REB2_BORBO|nr:hypothetical protein [Bordetella bronchiseptica]KCV34117.1 hypothetical protein L490_3355 [Bordetella bronchiseptica 00-P-2796]